MMITKAEEKAFMKGFKAFEEDPSRFDCPFKKPYSVERHSWIKGYDEAQKKHEDKITTSLLGVEID